MRYFNPPPAGQVSVEVKFLLQLQGLIAGVSSPSPFPFGPPEVVCKRNGKWVRLWQQGGLA